MALGGNALAPKGTGSFQDTVKALRAVAPVLVDLASKHKLVLVHGSGPQAGALLLQNELTKTRVPEMPLDVLDAEVQGQLGYIIEQVLMDEMHKRHVQCDIVTVVTRILVDGNDPGFKRPTKPVGGFYTKAQADTLKKPGKVYRDDAGRGYRRFVASPKPLDVVEKNVVRMLVDRGVVVIAAGGGGIPVMRKNGKLLGAAAVIDKDLAASLVGRIVDADVLLIITNVPFACINYRQKNEHPLKKIHLKDAKIFFDSGYFAEGSMAPKILAAIDFLQHGGKKVVITDPSHVAQALRGDAGTIIMS